MADSADDLLTQAIENLLWISVVAVALAVWLRSRGWSIALPLFAVGVVIGLVPVGPTAPDAPEAIQALVLAPLVFGEALASSYIDIKRVRRPVLALALGLVAATTLVVGGVTTLMVAAIPAAMAFSIGAILAPTDAVAVANAARRANLPRRVVSILEGESLVNDGTGMTALRVAIVAAVAGGVTIGEAGVILAQSVLVAVVVGAISGWVLVWVLRRSSDVVGFGGLLLVAPFPIYALAERFEGSGILALVIAALMASHASHSDPSYRGRLAVATVWRQITFILQSIAFLLLGLELPAAIVELPASQRHLLLPTVALVAATLIATRMVLVVASVAAGRTLLANPDPRTRTGLRGALIVGWAGARGPVSALAAFSLPLLTAAGAPLPYRDFSIAVALCVVAITLVLAPALGPFARRLRIPPDDPASSLTKARKAMALAALSALESAEQDAYQDDDPLSPEVIRTLRHQVERRADPAVDTTGAVARVQQITSVGIAMAEAEQRELLRLRAQEGMPDSIIRPLLAEVDRRISALRANRTTP